MTQEGVEVAEEPLCRAASEIQAGGYWTKTMVPHSLPSSCPHRTEAKAVAATKAALATLPPPFHQHCRVQLCRQAPAPVPVPPHAAASQELGQKRSHTWAR